LMVVWVLPENSTLSIVAMMRSLIESGVG